MWLFKLKYLKKVRLDERGNVSVFIALSLPLIALLINFLIIDFGYKLKDMDRLQTAADAAVTAGVGKAYDVAEELIKAARREQHQKQLEEESKELDGIIKQLEQEKDDFRDKLDELEEIPRELKDRLVIHVGSKGWRKKNLFKEIKVLVDDHDADKLMSAWNTIEFLQKQEFSKSRQINGLRNQYAKDLKRELNSQKVLNTIGHIDSGDLRGGRDYDGWVKNTSIVKGMLSKLGQSARNEAEAYARKNFPGSQTYFESNFVNGIGGLVRVSGSGGSPRTSWSGTKESKASLLP